MVLKARHVALAALLLSACSADDGAAGDTGTPPPRDGAVFGDTGSTRLDASTSPTDSGSGGGGGAGVPLPAGPPSALADAAEDPAGFVGDPSSCWDGMDNDGNLESDCEDASCLGAPACGLGSGTQCASEATTSFVASSCGDEPATPTCLAASVTPFGSPAPWVVSGRLHPGGDDYDSGLVLDDALSPRSRRVVMTGTFGAPTCPPGVSSCLEYAAFGVSETPTFGTTTRVHPTAALLLSLARHELALVIGDATIERWPFDDASPEWTLDLRPTGEVVVSNAGMILRRAPYAPPATAAAIIYGRNINRADDEPGGAGLESFSMSTSLCDIPDAWSSRDPLTVVDPSGEPIDVSTLRAPSVRRGGDGVLYLALEAAAASGQSRIVVAAEDGSDTRFALQHPSDSQVLAAADTSAGVTRVGDPELYWDDATSTWHLFFTGDFGDEQRIGHASGDNLSSMTFTDWVVTPSGNVRAVAQPSVARSYDEHFILAARTSHDDGEALAIYVATAAEGPYEAHAGSLAMETFRSGGDRSGFDADEVGAPSLRVVGSAYHLYFAGRHGTRWGIGVWTSAELVYWRPVTKSRALLHGDGNGFDALGTRDPEILVEGEATRLFYLGDDGNLTGMGVASRPSDELSP